MTRRAAALALLWLLAPALTLADASPGELGHADPAALSGEEIYARVIANRFRAFTEESSLVSADRSGREQETRLRMHWKDFRDGNGEPTDGVRSKAVVRYTHPTDIRHAGYLVQANAGRTNDQFIYYPSKRRVVRVSLRHEALHGTDFSFEDVIPRELEDATYRRQADAEYGGVPVFVVELVPREKTRSEYSKVWVYVDKDRFVPLRSRYWDSAGVEIKELATGPGHAARVRRHLDPDGRHHAPPPARDLDPARDHELRPEPGPRRERLRPLPPRVALRRGEQPGRQPGAGDGPRRMAVAWQRSAPGAPGSRPARRAWSGAPRSATPGS